MKIVGPTGFQVFSDFDGTISTLDSLKALLFHFGGERWKALEAGILNGTLAEREALPEMFSEFGLSIEGAQEFVLQNVRIDPTFVDFADWCELERIPVTVLSGGFGCLIRPLLERVDLGHLTVISNEAFQNGTGWRVQEAASGRNCLSSSHCKCASIESNRSRNANPEIVYVGDGHTDFCAAQKADLIFAKSHLAMHLERVQKPYQTFSDFSDIQGHLESLQAQRQAA